jgi:glycine oxidase
MGNRVHAMSESSDLNYDSIPKSTDAVVVGAGLIGLAIGWKLSERSVTTCICDPSPMGGASRVGAGMLAPVTEVHYGEVPLLHLNLESARMYPGFLKELAQKSEIDPDYRQGGILLVAKDSDDRAALDELAAYQSTLGLDPEAMTASGCRELEPLLSPAIRGGVLARSDASIDNRKLGRALLEAAANSGALILRRRVEEIVVEGGRARGVILEGGMRLEAGHVVLAAGCYSAGLGGIPHEALPPVRPVKGQLLIASIPENTPALSMTIRGLVHGRNVYLVARSDRRVVVGGTVEEMGFDTSVTIGALLDLLRDAYELIPNIVEFEVLETLAGLRPGSPDNAPIIGEGDIEGLVYATGHFRNGILLTPATAYAVAEFVSTGAIPEYARPFGPSRFGGSKSYSGLHEWS